MRELTADDASFAFELNNNPNVIKYTGDEAFSSIEEAKEFLEKYKDYQKYGIGRWGVVDKITRELVGWCGLKYSPDLNEIDLGYRLFEKEWNKGIATEVGKACLDFGFNINRYQEIVARVMLENIASIKVIEKIGFQRVEPYTFEEEKGLKYLMNKDEFYSLNE